MRSPDLSTERRTVTWRDQAWLASMSLVVVAGLAVDTRRHRQANRLDTFYTPAHGLVYAGWVAVFALRTGQGRKILYDGERGVVTNIPEANQYLTREYRAGWAV